MSNSWTGDFDAVVQVSEGTVNRLVATMHQNAWSDKDTPSLPHSVSFRIGDDEVVWGHRGWLQAQLGAPRLRLHDGSTDRFTIEVAVTARYRADDGSEPLPEFIDGTVTADYRIVDIPADCWGYAAVADEYVWVRVIEDTVRFDGTTDHEARPFSVLYEPSDSAADDEKVTRLVRILLATRFDPTPQRVHHAFRRGAMRSIASASGRAVAIPVSRSGGVPPGDITTVTDVLTGGRDVAVAISAGMIVSAVQGNLDDLRDMRTQVRFRAKATFGIDWVTVDVTWGISVHDVVVTWLGGASALSVLGYGDDVGLVKIAFRIQARTSETIFNVDADVAVHLAVSFDASGQVFHYAGLGAPAVSVRTGYDGPFAGELRAYIRDQLSGLLAPHVPAGDVPVGGAAARLQDQLKRLDKGAGVRLTDAQFGTPGVVVRGTVDVSPRSAPAISFDVTHEGDGFSAFQAWIPGGQINRLRWSWKWQGGDAGSSTWDDRYVLQRPLARRGKFGAVLHGVGSEPLPVLDGFGQMCLTVDGEVVDPVTGVRTAISASGRCRRSYLRLALTSGLKLRDVPDLARDVPFPQLAVYSASERNAAGNTLVVHCAERLDDHTVETLRRGLESVERDDAGLSVLVLHREGVLTTAAAGRLARDFEPLVRELGVHVVINEDVDGAWAHRLAINGDGRLGWRLLSPGGGVRFMHDGELDPRGLAAALDECLVASPATTLGLGSEPAVGTTLEPGVFDRSIESAIWSALEPQPGRCPPPRWHGIDTMVLFVSGKTTAEMIAAARSEVGRVVAVVDGVDDEAARAIAREIGLDTPARGDRDGAIAGRLGVRVWPTAIHVDGRGTVRRVDVGVPDARPDHSDAAARTESRNR